MKKPTENKVITPEFHGGPLGTPDPKAPLMRDVLAQKHSKEAAAESAKEKGEDVGE